MGNPCITRWLRRVLKHLLAFADQLFDARFQGIERDVCRDHLFCGARDYAKGRRRIDDGDCLALSMCHCRSPKVEQLMQCGQVSNTVSAVAESGIGYSCSR